MTVLGIVPARGGSKGLTNKNLRALGGQSLLARTAEAVRSSRSLTRTVLSTDDPAIAEAGRALGFDVPFMRPAELAADETPMLPVLQHAVQTLARGGFQADVVVLLQPTSPFRRAEHIDAAVDLLATSGQKLQGVGISGKGVFITDANMVNEADIGLTAKWRQPHLVDPLVQLPVRKCELCNALILTDKGDLPGVIPVEFYAYAMLDLRHALKRHLEMRIT